MNSLSKSLFLEGGASTDLETVCAQIRSRVHLVRKIDEVDLEAVLDGEITISGNGSSHELVATLPPLYPEWLGDRSFQEVHGCRFPYIGGAMARGIASAEMVIALARGGMLGFFGSAGMTIQKIVVAIDQIQAELDPVGLNYGFNLINSLYEPALEDALVDLYLERGVKRISAAAYINISEPLVRFWACGLTASASGEVIPTNFIFAKISRSRVAEKFLAPPPAKIIESLLSKGAITKQQAELAARAPLAEDITVEGDSGGHTDNQLLISLLPTIMGLRDSMTVKHNFKRPIRVGAAGGMGTPTAVAAAFSLGAAYVVTGSVNQCSVEAGVCESAKTMLLSAGINDVMMAPSADMFEMGAKVQVLKKGTMFGLRANNLYKLFSQYKSMEDIPEDQLEKLEVTVFKKPWQDIWASTVSFFEENDPKKLKLAQEDPHVQMALIFRWYLGLASKWAVSGEPERERDYQIWCGPALGSFNAWVKGHFLEKMEERKVVQIALNLLEGAAVATRAQQLRTYGLPVHPSAFNYIPRPFKSH